MNALLGVVFVRRIDCTNLQFSERAKRATFYSTKRDFGAISHNFECGGAAIDHLVLTVYRQLK